MLVAMAIVPSGITMIPSIYAMFVLLSLATYPLSLLYGALWWGFFRSLYEQTDIQDREQFQWVGLLVIFAAVLPVHMILVLLGMPSRWPQNFAPL